MLVFFFVSPPPLLRQRVFFGTEGAALSEALGVPPGAAVTGGRTSGHNGPYTGHFWTTCQKTPPMCHPVHKKNFLKVKFFSLWLLRAEMETVLQEYLGSG